MKNRLCFTLLLFFVSLIVLQNQEANAQVTLVGDKIQAEYVSPGDQYTGSVMIHNESESVMTVRVYQDAVSALTSFDSGDEIVTIDRSNAGWISHNAEKMTIQPGQVAKVEYQVVVPLTMGAEPPTGTYWSSLTVDVIALGSSEYRKPYSRHYLTDIATHIEGTGKAGLAINNVKMLGDRDARRLQAMMINTGNTLVKPMVWFELYDTSGNLEGRIAGKSDWVFPGGFHRVTADVADVEPGVYETQIVVDDGKSQIFGASFTVDMTGIGTVAQTHMQRTTF